MWYDATSAAGSLEAADSPVQGQDRLRAGAGGEDRRTRAGCTPGRGPSRRRARRRTTPGSSSPGPRARSTRSWSATKLGWASVPAGKRGLDLREPGVPQGGVRRSPNRPRTRSRTPTRRTRASSPAQRSASSSSTSPSSRRWGPRCRRTSVRDRRTDERGTRPSTRPAARVGRRRALPGTARQMTSGCRGDTRTISTPRGGVR